MRKKIIISSLIFIFCSTASFAWIWLIPTAARSFLFVARLGVGVGTSAVSTIAANANFYKAAEITAGLVSIVPLIDHFFFSDDPKVNANGKVNTQTVVLLKPNNQRQNPDPKKFDDPLLNDKDVRPKQSFEIDKESTLLAPTTYPNIVAENGVGISKWYQNSSSGVGANQDRRFNILLAFNPNVPDGTNTNLCPSSAISQTQLGSDYQFGWCGLVNSKNYAVGYQIKDRLCPSGYLNDNGICKLNDASVVMKPENKVSCEVLKNSDGTFSTDLKNPECLKNTKLKVTSNKVTYTHDSNTFDEIQSNSDGSITIKTRSPTTNGDLKLGKYDSNLDGFPTVATTNYGTTPPTELPGSEVGNGSTFGEGCGQYASAPCAVSIDDSSFANKDIAGVASAALSDSNSAYDSLKNKVDELSKDDLNQFKSDWLPRPNIAAGQCVPIQINILNAKLSINICPWIALLSQAMGYLFYMFSALYIFRSFTDSSKD